MNWLSRILATVRPASTTNPQTTSPATKLPPNMVLIDVRSAGEFDAGHIEGAINLPLDRLERDISSVVPEKATPLLLYCRSGARSGRACEIVSQLGYAAARNGGGIGSLALSLGRGVTRS
jgi:phage shock protein E